MKKPVQSELTRSVLDTVDDQDSLEFPLVIEHRLFVVDGPVAAEFTHHQCHL